MFTLIIADDHAIIRDGLRRIIEEVPGYKVVGEASDGLQTVRMVRKLNPDLLILDISMPNLRGIEAITKIRKFNKQVKILILTMHKSEDYAYECLKAGAQGYILKEDADDELITAIQTLRKGQIYLSSSLSDNVIRELLRRRKTQDRSKFELLTTREREVLKMIAEGNSNKKIAEKLGISIRTVEHHRLRISKKLGFNNITELVKFAIRVGLIDLD
ncbi:hypothetical protein BXT86_05570 [candidate division WOR-3 bacterium 4484_100]|uniref:DNA-binding response regulator n=1 Tax=candidate division WOR-3 bacterium 4484_100 TaxID=1936077 RepID=A0A1V4QE51_UNCW3|nr:MAG: hypothetical protein BXT86_05570 [candidate division WOR-3 bacterium 4484_100]